jgi:hypothetical protein
MKNLFLSLIKAINEMMLITKTHAIVLWIVIGCDRGGTFFGGFPYL